MGVHPEKLPGIVLREGQLAGIRERKSCLGPLWLPIFPGVGTS